MIDVMKGASRAAGIIAVAGVTCAVACASPAAAEEIHVYPGESIQAAINSADDGDEVVVHPGTYYEAIDFNGKPITLRSENGPSETTIDGTGHETSVVQFRNMELADSVLDGFTITGGSGTHYGADRHGGGIFVQAAGPTVRDCIVIGNSADVGAGMSQYMGWGVVASCRFINNVTEDIGAKGGAGLAFTGGSIAVVNCWFEDNYAESGASGGGARFYTGEANVANCVFTGNSAMVGGGIYSKEARLNLINCTIVDNSALLGGGGASYINVPSAPPTIANCIIWGNESENYADGLRVDNCPPLVIQQSVLQEDWDGEGGGNIYEDPLFIDASANQFELTESSPCVNSGAAATLVPDVADIDNDGDLEELLPRDFLIVDENGSPRLRMIGTVDIGAFEHQGLDGGGDPEPTCVAADIDDNGFVETSDLLQLLADWGACPEGMPGCQGDIDEDGMVATDDLLELLSMWGPCEDG